MARPGSAGCPQPVAAPSWQGRLCSFKSPPSQPKVSRKNLTRFSWWMLMDKLEQPVAFSIHFPHSPLGRLLMKEPIVPLQRSRQVGREQRRLQEPSTAGYSHSSGRKSCRGGCPGAETSTAGCLATAQATGNPALQLPGADVQVLQALRDNGSSSRAPCTALAAPAGQSATQGHGSLPAAREHSGDTIAVS